MQLQRPPPPFSLPSTPMKGEAGRRGERHDSVVPACLIMLSTPGEREALRPIRTRGGVASPTTEVGWGGAGSMVEGRAWTRSVRERGPYTTGYSSELTGYSSELPRSIAANWTGYSSKLSWGIAAN